MKPTTVDEQDQSYAHPVQSLGNVSNLSGQDFRTDSAYFVPQFPGQQSYTRMIPEEREQNSFLQYALL